MDHGQAADPIHRANQPLSSAVHQSNWFRTYGGSRDPTLQHSFFALLHIKIPARIGTIHRADPLFAHLNCCVKVL